MNFKCPAILVSAVVTLSAGASGQDGVQFKVLLIRDGNVVSSPTVVGEFGKRVTVDLSQTMRVEAIAQAPEADGSSLTAVKLSLFENGVMGPAKEMSMRANLASTPSFEYSVPGTNARFVVVPRLARLAGEHKE